MKLVEPFCEGDATEIHLTQPLAAMVANGEIPPETVVRVELSEDGGELVLEVAD